MVKEPVFRAESGKPLRGRKPKPVAQQIAEGDPRKRGVHKLDQKLADEPKAQRGLPDCPRHLKGRARAAWGFWRAELEAMNLDCRPDAMMLEGACLNYSRAVQADLLVAAAGLLLEEPITDSEGDVVGTKYKANPAISISSNAWRNVRAFCSEFGLSPVSRTRLTIEKKDDAENELLDLLSKPRAQRAGAIQ